MTMICLGIDPDTKDTGIALVQATDPTRASRAAWKVLYVATASVDESLSVQRRIILMRDAIEFQLLHLPVKLSIQRIAVEGQVKYPNDKVRPNDLIHLAQVAGMAAASGTGALGVGPDLWIPEPFNWKGNAPKGAYKLRILRNAGLCKGLAGVPGAEGMSQTQKGHVIDAIGLAIWVSQQPARRATG